MKIFIFVVLAMAALGLLMHLSNNYVNRKEQKAIRTEADTFFRLIGEGNTNEAYFRTALAYQSQINQKAFEKTFKDLKFAGYMVWYEREFKKKYTPHYAYELEGDAVFQNGQVVSLGMNFRKEKNQWKIHLIRRATLATEAPK